MTIQELADYIKRVDKKKLGCTVEFTHVHIPGDSTPVYGIVTWGMDENQRIFHDEAELVEVLAGLAK